MITVYHGSNIEIPKPSLDGGRADTDFGTGFYVTNTLTVIGEKRQSFETFKSNVCHLVKAYGELAFIKNVLCSNEVQKLYKKQSGYHFESASELTSLLYLQTGAAKAAIIRR